MKNRAVLMLGVALFMAGASVFLAHTWIRSQVRTVPVVRQEPANPTTKILVAASDLSFGNKIRREQLLLVDWPKSSVPEGAFGSIQEVLGDGSGRDVSGKPVEDRVVLRMIAKNEPILAHKITGFGGRASLSTLLSPGMRATTIRVNDVNGVAGFVLPGDRVDILITHDPNASAQGNREQNLTTEVLLQNMKVLGIDQDANEDRTKPIVARAVTLEVTTIQAQKLTLAQKLGELSLALRHVTTTDAEKPTTITARDLRAGEANQTPEMQASEPAEEVVTRAAETKKPVVTKTVTAQQKNSLATVRIVRGLAAAEYEVQPEKPSVNAPAYPTPVDLLPSGLAPQLVPMAPNLARLPRKRAPGAGAGAKDATLPGALGTESLSPSEPIGLLKDTGRAGGDG